MRTFQLTQMVRGGLVLLGLGHLILNGADLCDGRRHVCRSLCRAFSLELGRFSQSRRYVRLIVPEVFISTPNSTMQLMSLSRHLLAKRQGRGARASLTRKVSGRPKIT
jgi:hypothetical protein